MRRVSVSFAISVALKPPATPAEDGGCGIELGTPIASIYRSLARSEKINRQ
jgi:hypothetical protein